MFHDQCFTGLADIIHRYPQLYLIQYAGIQPVSRYAGFNPTSRAVLSPRSSDGDGAGRKGKALDHKRKKKLRQSGWETKTATIVQLVNGCVRLIAAITKLAQMLDDWTL
jgi:hypothetical protein